MYRITYTPTSKIIAIATTWQDAAATLRRHADTHNDDTYNAVTADPSVILHLDTMGDGAYIITRDEGDLRACSHCDRIGIVTNQSDGYPLSAGSWSIACCANCAAEWERDYPREPSDYRADDIRRIVTARIRIDGLRHIATESRGLINDAALAQALRPCTTCGMDAWDCAAHHGDTHYHA
jgi:hypothetical protein